MHIEMSLFGDEAPRKSLVSLFRVTRLRHLRLGPVTPRPDGTDSRKTRRLRVKTGRERPDHKVA